MVLDKRYSRARQADHKYLEGMCKLFVESLDSIRVVILIQDFLKSLPRGSFLREGKNIVHGPVEVGVVLLLIATGTGSVCRLVHT